MLKDKILDRFKEALDNLVGAAQQEIRQQGHVATGKGLRSLEAIIESDQLERLVANIMVEDYMMPVDTGVSAGRIPFGGTGGGGKSDYIQGLVRWISIKRPSLSDQEKLSFAFAIAYTHKREGMPSKGSFRFSRNGRRTNWIQNGLVDKAQAIEDDLRLFFLIQQSYEEAVSEAATSF